MALLCAHRIGDGGSLIEFEEPFVLDTTKYTTTFGAVGTALLEAMRATVNAYRGESIEPRRST